MGSTSGSAHGGVVTSVNVGAPRRVDWHGRVVTTAIWKEPVTGRTAVAGVNLDGDDQADRRVHGGPDKAVYAYAAEDYAWWAAGGVAAAPGTFGENLTVAGVDVGGLAIGETWQVGTAVLRVTQPRFPCFKLGLRMGDAAFVERFAGARRFGAYFAIDTAGTVAAGDPMRRLTAPADRLTIDEFVEADRTGDPDGLRRLAAHPLVPDDWREHAARALRRRSAG